MQAVAREAGFDAQALDELAQREFGAPAMALTRRDASALIDLIQNQQAEVPLADSPAPRPAPATGPAQFDEEEPPF